MVLYRCKESYTITVKDEDEFFYGILITFPAILSETDGVKPIWELFLLSLNPTIYL